MTGLSNGKITFTPSFAPCAPAPPTCARTKKQLAKHITSATTVLRAVVTIVRILRSECILTAFLRTKSSIASLLPDAKVQLIFYFAKEFLFFFTSFC